MKITLLAAASLLAFGLATSSAQAAALTMPKEIVAEVATPKLEPVHFNHRSCQLGRAGWHYHRYGDRRECRPFRRRYY
jgi:hypothetical protein